MAKGRPAFQIDEGWGGAASRAVDGNRNSDYHKKSCTHTNANAKDGKNKNWWAVDLQSDHELESVAITNRADCCGRC